MPPPQLATVHRIRPRPSRQTETLQGTLDLGGWSEPVRVELNERLTRFLPETLSNAWSFTMITSDARTIGIFMKAINAGPRARSTLAVWLSLSPFVRRDTGEIICGQRRLAELSGVALADVSRALARLVEIGALLKKGKGSYWLNPHFAWNGSLANRERVAQMAPQLELVSAPAGE